VLRLAIGVGIGLFIAFIGLRNAGIIVNSDATLVTLGDVKNPRRWCRCRISHHGFSSGPQNKRRVVGWCLGHDLYRHRFASVAATTGIGSFVTLTNPIASLRPTAFSARYKRRAERGADSHPVFVYVRRSLDNIGTLVGVARKAGLLDERGQLPRIGKALFADSLGTMFGALMGTSTVTSYIESAPASPKEAAQGDGRRW